VSFQKKTKQMNILQRVAKFSDGSALPGRQKTTTLGEGAGGQYQVLNQRCTAKIH
jgi:hypothetical protein